MLSLADNLSQFLLVQGFYPNMGSSFLLKVRICQKPLKPFFHQGSSAFFTQNTSLCKSSNFNPGGRHKHRSNGGQEGVKNTSFSHWKEESWDDAGIGRGKRATVRQRPSFPTSVFTAGTAKRTAEIMRRKAAVISKDGQQQVEETKGRSSGGAGRTYRTVFGSHCFKCPSLKPECFTGKVQPPDRPLSAAEWRELKESLGNPPRFDLQMMCAIFTSGAELDIAR